MARKLLSVEEQLYELQLLRRDYSMWKRTHKWVLATLRRENRRLREEKTALLKYIKELEPFLKIEQDDKTRS